MTYMIGMKVKESNKDYAMLIADSRASEGDTPDNAVTAAENFPKNFRIPGNQNVKGTHDFLLGTTGNADLACGARQYLLNQGPFSHIGQVNETLLDYLDKVEEKWSYRPGVAFITAGPTEDKKMGLTHINKNEYEDGKFDCENAAQAGNGFGSRIKVLRNLGERGVDLSLSGLDLAVVLAFELTKGISNIDKTVNSNIQLGIVSYDGSTTETGLLYPTTISMPDDAFLSEGSEAFMESYLALMSGKESSIISGTNEKDELFFSTGQTMSDFYDLFIEALNQFSAAREAKDSEEESLSRQYVALGLRNLLSKGEHLANHIDSMRALPRFSKRKPAAIELKRA